jgi:hypothetical protein
MEGKAIWYLTNGALIAALRGGSNGFSVDGIDGDLDIHIVAMLDSSLTSQALLSSLPTSAKIELNPNPPTLAISKDGGGDSPGDALRAAVQEACLCTYSGTISMCPVDAMVRMELDAGPTWWLPMPKSKDIGNVPYIFLHPWRASMPWTRGVALHTNSAVAGLADANGELGLEDLVRHAVSRVSNINWLVHKARHDPCIFLNTAAYLQAIQNFTKGKFTWSHSIAHYEHTVKNHPGGPMPWARIMDVVSPWAQVGWRPPQEFSNKYACAARLFMGKTASSVLREGMPRAWTTGRMVEGSNNNSAVKIARISYKQMKNWMMYTLDDRYWRFGWTTADSLRSNLNLSSVLDT